MTLPESANQLTGVVLAGGQSRRFGRDKALASFRQTTMIGHSIALLRAASKEVFVVTHPARDYLGLDATVIHDIYPDHGPLGGLYTACRYAKTPYIMTLTCDMPLLSPRAIFHLIHSHDQEVSACIYRHKTGLQPFPGIYAVKLQPQLKEALKQGQHSMKAFLSAIDDVRTVALPGDEAELMNINTPSQFMSLQRRNRHSRKDNDNETKTIPNTPHL